MNAVLHRNYESNSPVRFYLFEDRIEIQNTGGLYGEVSPENLPDVTDYRNPVLAELLMVMKYANRYKSVIVESGVAARTMAAYIELNPARGVLWIMRDLRVGV